MDSEPSPALFKFLIILVFKLSKGGLFAWYGYVIQAARERQGGPSEVLGQLVCTASSRLVRAAQKHFTSKRTKR